MFGRCVNAEPAEDFAALEAVLLARVLDAAVPAFFPVSFDGALVCDKVDPAADFEALLAVGLLRTLEAAEAAFFPVISFLVISNPSIKFN